MLPFAASCEPVGVKTTAHALRGTGEPAEDVQEAQHPASQARELYEKADVHCCSRRRICNFYAAAVLRADGSLGPPNLCRRA